MGSSQANKASKSGPITAEPALPPKTLFTWLVCGQGNQSDLPWARILCGIRRLKEYYRATLPHHVGPLVLTRVRLEDLQMLTDKQTLLVWGDSSALHEEERSEHLRQKVEVKERVKSKTKQKAKRSDNFKIN